MSSSRKTTNPSCDSLLEGKHAALALRQRGSGESRTPRRVGALKRVYKGVVATGGGVRKWLYARPPAFGARLSLTPHGGVEHEESVPAASGCEKKTVIGDSAHHAGTAKRKTGGNTLQVGTAFSPVVGKALVVDDTYKKLNEGRTTSTKLRYTKPSNHATLKASDRRAGLRSALPLCRVGAGSRKAGSLSPRINRIAANKKPQPTVTGYRPKTHSPIWTDCVQRHRWNPSIGTACTSNEVLSEGHPRYAALRVKADVVYRPRGAWSVLEPAMEPGVKGFRAGVPSGHASVRDCLLRSGGDVITVRYGGVFGEASTEDVSGFGAARFGSATKADHRTKQGVMPGLVSA